MKIFTAAGILTVAAALSACGGAAGEDQQTAANKKVLNVASQPANPTGSNSGPQPNAATPAGFPADPQIAAGQPAGNSANNTEPAAATQPPPVSEEEMTPLQRARKERIDALKARDKGDPNAPPVVTPVPAPDDSTYSASLTKDMVETRTFNSHPSIAKVVKTVSGKRSSIKVYFRNGKTKDLAGDAIKDLGKVPAEDIVRIAGAQ